MNISQNAQLIIPSFAPSVLRAENKLKRVDYMETAKGSFSLEVMDPDNISGWKDEDPYFGSEKRGKNIILYDWFAMTSKVDSVESLLNQLGLKTSLPFKETKGFYGYRSRLKFDGISIYYDYCYKDTDYPLLELTGQGCRDYETYTDGNWGRLFQLALDTDNYHVTRLDVAYDDHEGILDINKIVRKTEKRHFVSRSQVGTITNSFDRDKDAYSVMYGGRSSELYCRIYDKALERGYSDGRHWVRCETVFKGDRAYNFIKNDDPIGAKYCGVLKNYIRFVEPNENDSNKRRWNVSKWWDKFLGDCKRISVCSPKTVDYNLSRVGRYVFHQAGNCVDTYIQCVGIIQFLNELKVRDTVLTPHQKRLIDEYKAHIAAENNNCNTNTAAASIPGDVNCNTNTTAASIPGDVNCNTNTAVASIAGDVDCNTNRASASIPGDVNCNTNTAAASPALERNCNTSYVPAGDDWVTKGL